MRILLFGIIAALLVMSCIKESPRENSKFIDIQVQKSGLFGLVSDIGANVISPGYDKLARDTKNLENSISEQCAGRGVIDRAVLKKAFIKAIRSYHFTEAFQISVIARNNYQLREQMYSWPRSNSYLVDVEIAEKQKDSSYKYRGLPTSIGFPALEYLIYKEHLTNQCQNCGVELLESWNHISDDEKWKSHCEYMKYVANFLSKNTQKLSDDWKPVNGDITLSQAYKKDFKVLKEFTVKLTHGFMFFDKELKGRRLGIPSGINYDLCGFDSCPEQSEHLFSKDSIASLLYTTKGFLAVFTGDKINKNLDINGSGYGYEEWLTEKGYKTLSQNLKSKLIEFIQNLQKLQTQSNIELLAKDVQYKPCKETTSENRIVEICALYQDLKQITDLYKNDFLLAINFGRPNDQGGDTD